MKIVFVLAMVLLPLVCFSQNLTLDISTPQPRLGETFTLTVEVDTIATNVFSFLSSRFIVSGYRSTSNSGSALGTTLQATKIGHNEIGPLTLTINGKKYIANKIAFEVVDSLPAVNKGLWIRQAPIDDSSEYIILEQRIPALTYITRSDSTINMTTKANDDEKEIEMVKDVQGINFAGSTEDYRSIIDPKTGQKKDFKFFFALYRIVKTDKNKPMVITKISFNNMPDYYDFKDVVFK